MQEQKTAPRRYHFHIEDERRAFWSRVGALAGAVVYRKSGSRLYVTNSYDDLVHFLTATDRRFIELSVICGLPHDTTFVDGVEVNDPPVSRVWSTDSFDVVAPILDVERDGTVS